MFDSRWPLHKKKTFHVGFYNIAFEIKDPKGNFLWSAKDVNETTSE